MTAHDVCCCLDGEQHCALRVASQNALVILKALSLSVQWELAPDVLSEVKRVANELERVVVKA